jgi:hypothetical protein
LVAAVLAVVLVVAAISPLVQTWVAQFVLGRQTAFHGSVSSLSARFGHLEVADLRLNFDGVVLTVPNLEAALPVTTAIRGRRLLVRSLVAKGWTLDLSRSAGPAGPAGQVQSPAAVTGPPAAPARSAAESARDAARDAARAVLGAVSRWELPCDLSLDGVDLEGDVLVPVAGRTAPARVHVTIKGGGMAAGRDGTFAFDAGTDLLDPNFAVTTFAAHGQLIAAMNTPRALRRVEIKAAVSASGGLFGNGVAVTADVAAARDAGGETYSVDLSSGDRHLATVSALFPGAAAQLSGTWKLDLRDSDVAQFVTGQTLPPFTAAGSGRFEADVAFTSVHAVGRLRGTTNQLDVVAPILGRLGAVAFDAGFDASQSGRSLRLDRFEVSLTGGTLAASMRALQPFTVDEAAGALQPMAPARDWAEVSCHGIPSDWLSGVVDGFGFSGGEAAGDFVVRQDQGTWALRSVKPFTAAGVAVVHDGRIVARRLDLELSVLADRGPAGWHFQAAPLKVGSGGRPLAELEVTASRAAGPDQPIAFQGAWKADLQAPAFQEAVPDLREMGGRSASGDFSGTAGAETKVEGKLQVVGRDEHRSVAASVQATVDESGRIEFLAPVKIAFGPSVSDVAVQGTLIHNGATPYLYLKLSGKEADLAHLRLLGGAAAAIEGLSLAAAAGPEAPAAVRDQHPFWGDWTGHVSLDFDHLRAGALDLANVAGACAVDQSSIHVEGGRAALAGHHLENLAGSLAFDGAAGLPYQLKVTLSAEPIDAGAYFPAADAYGSPMIEGRFTVAATVEGAGTNLPDLLHRTQETVRLASTAGIVRVLKTDVDEAVPPETESKTGDTLGRIGSGIGSIFGVKGGIGSGRRAVSPATQAAIDVVNATSEIGFDELTVTAVRGADRNIRLVDLAMTAGDLHITGSGQIAWVAGVPLRGRPLTVDLQFGARGQMAKLLSAAGLLSARKDGAGFTLLAQPLVFGGTLAHIDNGPWHAVLVKAAQRNPGAPPAVPAGHP